MDMKNAYEPLNLSDNLINTINKIVDNNNKETQVNIYDNSHINPSFRYYNDDTNLNLTPQLVPRFTYKNKSIFSAEKPIQTEHDEVGINESFLKSHYGYTNYGNYYVANQSLPESWKHKATPKNNIYELN